MYFNSKSLAQVWILLKKKLCNVGIPRSRKSKYGKAEVIRLKWLNCVLYLILSIGMPYYQEGCNIDYLIRSKVLIGHPSEDPKREPLRNNLVLLG